jgi:2-dehydro-3-deoxygalactonokinase
MSFRDGYIAVDWGTTNRRAYRIASDGSVTDSFEDERGLMAVPKDGFESAAAEIRTRLGELPMLLGGMVGSNRGWREAAYVPCPAGPEGLAERILWIEPGRTGIVPGVCQGAPDEDVMRGEEVQVLGAVAAGQVPPNGLLCHPGTHAKWIRLEGGRIVAFNTMMTGELFSLISKHSILGEQLQGEVAADDDFRRGVDEGLAGRDLLSTLFGIRARHVLGVAHGSAASYASGLLIGSDVRAGLALGGDGLVALIGRPDLCVLYAEALRAAGRETVEVDGAVAFLAGIHMLTEML